MLRMSEGLLLLEEHGYCASAAVSAASLKLHTHAFGSFKPCYITCKRSQLLLS